MIMMVMFSFLGGAAVYRANVHIAVEALLNAVSPRCAARCCGAWTRAWPRPRCSCWATASSCASSRGTRRWPSFRRCRQALVYLPIPIAGLLTLLFLIERVWIGEPPPTSFMYSDQAAELE